MEELSQSKNKLFDALGDDYRKYLDLLKLWFSHKLDKSEFDNEARRFLNKDTINYHNKFLVSLLTRCHNLSSSMSIDTINQDEPKRKKQKVKPKSKNASLIRMNLDNRLNATVFNQNLNELNKNNLNLLNDKRKLIFCTTEGTLPDYFMSNLRLFVNCWEYGIDGITDESIDLINLAIRDFIKNIILSILTFKSDFRTCENEKFKYGFGTGLINPFLLNSTLQDNESNLTSINENGDQEPALPYTKDHAIHNALVKVACSICSKSVNNKINLWHLYYCLKNDPSCIPAHSVKETNIQRILQRLPNEIN